MNAITEFQGEYRFLSNFYPAPLTLMGWQFPTSEHAFMAQKSSDPNYWKHVHEAPTPSMAKSLGRSVELREDWDEFRDTAMRLAVACKFTQNADLLRQLLETGERELIEGNHWHDQYWGSCFCERHKWTRGRNQLGKTLMAFRDYWRAD